MKNGENSFLDYSLVALRERQEYTFETSSRDYTIKTVVFCWELAIAVSHWKSAWIRLV